MPTIKDAALGWREESSDANEGFGIVAKSSVAIERKKGWVSIRVKVVVGEEHLIDGLKAEAVRVYKEIKGVVGLKGSIKNWKCLGCGRTRETDGEIKAVICCGCLEEMKEVVR